MEVGTAPVWCPVRPACHRVPGSVHLQWHHRGLPQPGAEEHSQEHPKEHGASVSSLSNTIGEQVKEKLVLILRAGVKEVQVQKKRGMHLNASDFHNRLVCTNAPGGT